MKERPLGVPEIATWDPSDNEWVHAPLDGNGNKYGLVTYWRPDGTLVNHCEFEHGKPHGYFKRYHESGEVSRSGTFVRGVMHGIDACFRTTTKTTERAFPTDRMPANVWRYEVDMDMGKVTGARWFDQFGNQVTETGEPIPDRPPQLPPKAVYLSKSATWLFGETDDKARRHGIWRTWDRAGAPVGEVEFDHGNEIGKHSFVAPEDAEVHDALRAGLGSRALAAARGWWQRAEVASEQRIFAGTALCRCLGEGNSEERRRIATEVADCPGVMWVFTDNGKRAYQAQAEVLDWLANDALNQGHFEHALALATRAIATEHHYGPCAARLTRIAALRKLGRDEEAFLAAKDLLAINPDAAGLDDVRSDARFAAWLASIRTDTMTIDGAWDVLGRRGELLTAIAAPIAAPIADPTSAQTAGDLDVPWPIADVLRSRLSPELLAWNHVATDGLRSTYRGDFCAAASSSLSAAVTAEDGTWLARIHGLFLPVAAILIQEEEIWHASWVANEHGNSTVYYTHQDEHGLWPSGAISVFLAERVLDDSDLDVPGHTRARWTRAVELLRTQVPGDSAPHLNVARLVDRSEWIVSFLTGVGSPQLAAASSVADWQIERLLTAEWPHLQAYWLFHHLVFDNREELVELCTYAEHRHPTVHELAELATAYLDGQIPRAQWWDTAKVAGLRTSAKDGKHEHVFSPAATARLAQALMQRDAATLAVASARTELLASNDERAERILAAIDLLSTAAGRPDEIENDLVMSKGALDGPFKGDAEAQMDYLLRQKNGHTSALANYMRPLLTDAMPQACAFFRAMVAQGAAFEEDHGTVIPGSLVGLGGAMGDFAAFRAWIEAAIPAELLGRRRRMEMTLVAEHQIEQPAAYQFLCVEAERYAYQLASGSWQVNTVGFSLSTLLKASPQKGGALLCTALQDTQFSGANWKSAISLIKTAGENKVAAATDGILAALDRGLGRHDDGDRAQIVRAYASCAGEAGIPALAKRLGLITDVRRACESAALLAGLLVLEPQEPRWILDAHKTLDELLAQKVGSMEGGAAISLLQAIDACQIAGFAEQAAVIAARVQDEKYVKTSFKTWLHDALLRLSTY